MLLLLLVLVASATVEASCPACVRSMPASVSGDFRFPGSFNASGRLVQEVLGGGALGSASCRSARFQGGVGAEGWAEANISFTCAGAGGGGESRLKFRGLLSTVGCGADMQRLQSFGMMGGSFAWETVPPSGLVGSMDLCVFFNRVAESPTSNYLNIGMWSAPNATATATGGPAVPEGAVGCPSVRPPLNELLFEVTHLACSGANNQKDSCVSVPNAQCEYRDYAKQRNIGIGMGVGGVWYVLVACFFTVVVIVCTRKTMQR